MAIPVVVPVEARVEFHLLGPLQVVVDGTPVMLRGAGERSLLALLLLDAGRVVPAEHLIDSLWGEDLPHNALNALQGRVSRLRQALRKVGLPVAVGNATPEVRAIAKVQLKREGGRGAVREFAELLLKARGEWETTWNTYVGKRSAT